MLTVAVNAMAFYLGAICLHRLGMVAGIAVFVGTGFPGTVICSFVEHELKEFIIARWGGRPVIPHTEAVPVTIMHRGVSSVTPFGGADRSGSGPAERYSIEPIRR